MKEKMEKAYAITDAKISFVSLVDRAANQKKFLITKQEGDIASFTTTGRIIKADPDTHYVTGIVYEPMTEDAHGNFMTAEEITKACYWFMKNGDQVDLQHSFEPLKDAFVVENWVAKADYAIDDEPITKGTWLMTVEIADPDIWAEIENGTLTGFSMGGIGNYSEEDTDLGIEKTEDKNLQDEPVEKGLMEAKYKKGLREEKFWLAIRTMEDILMPGYNSSEDAEIFEQNETKIRETLAEFNEIVADLLLEEEPILNALGDARPESVQKEGKTLSTKNQDAIQSIYDQLGAFLESIKGADAVPVEDEIEKKEGHEMTESEVKKYIDETVAKAVEAQQPETPAEEPETVSKAAEEAPEEVTLEKVSELVSKAVADAMEPLLKSKGLPTNLNDSVEKTAKQHYLHGIL